MNASLRIAGAAGALILLAFLMALLAGVFEEKIPTGRVAAPPRPIAGPLVEVQLHRVPLVEEAVGTLRPREQTQISARVLSTVIAVTVREGDRVTKGDVLVELDRRDLTARLEQARQARAATQATLEEARATFERVRELAERGVAAAAELDRTEAALKTAQAELERSRQAVGEAETARSHATVRAPIDGRIIHRLVEPGDTASPGSPLLHLYDPEALRLEAQVRETLATRLTPGESLQVRIDALDLTVPSTVDMIVPAADPGSRSFVVKTSLPSLPEIYPGMFGRLLIQAGTVEHVSMPASALRRVGQLEYVLVAVDGSALRRYVRTGPARHDGRMEVLSGLRPGEQVVLPPATQSGAEAESPGRQDDTATHKIGGRI
ncbi:MAG: efflux RND transporter periplasmic adaptor subunit [Gammaproteobacteria bacterium]|nr:efflux RND transporter periplasmic adaptor subunit [Gammaproteobacteria bacterium]